MGAGIAEAAAVSGIPVVLRELPDCLDATRRRLDKSLNRAHERGKLSTVERDAALARVTVTSELSDVADAEIVIEALPEDAELKISIMKELGGIVGDDAVIASNTSSIPIAHLASAVHNANRVVGLHFFSPVPVMALVEVVRALDTSDETIDTAHTFVEQLGKRAIETQDRSGFIVNFLLIPYLMAAVRMYADDFATREDIDEGMKLGA
ncbi:MAG: 3-hydroxyacyl-CoA dehydrogenase NAD-binding domain-containing protein, partial [Actinomycetota bacterium]|nr:3-hydroxyacyl-CoA dehydrogenase NAD-binding domain-containing protein [Actinomycetota bacterium]